MRFRLWDKPEQSKSDKLLQQQCENPEFEF